MKGFLGLRRLHQWTGWVTLVLFLATGQYMRYLAQPPVAELEPGIRMLFRSRHIYLLFAALLNLAIARQVGLGGPRWLRVLGSTLLTLAPLLLLLAFTFETAVLGGPTALSIYGVQAALAGTLCHVVATWWRERT